MRDYICPVEKTLHYYFLIYNLTHLVENEWFWEGNVLHLPYGLPAQNTACICIDSCINTMEVFRNRIFRLLIISFLHLCFKCSCSPLIALFHISRHDFFPHFDVLFFLHRSGKTSVLHLFQWLPFSLQFQGQFVLFLWRWFSHSASITTTCRSSSNTTTLARIHYTADDWKSSQWAQYSHLKLVLAGDTTSPISTKYQTTGNWKGGQQTQYMYFKLVLAVKPVIASLHQL